ncbi:MAG: EF-P beta-lysylation protein EpmB [Ketobacteraceae bacterium]|nr:EF-P beta-lysylation protein EpmB [Ketobacteraceae bacterium]
MITRTAPTWHTEDWQIQLARGFSSVQELLTALGLEPGDLPAQLKAHGEFPLRVPRAFVRKMEPGNPVDPLLLQVLPQSRELLEAPGYNRDPLEETRFTPVPGLIHKYRSRVLLTTSSACAINCRYCFRRHFPYNDHRISRAQIHDITGYLARQPEVNEVIFSGGDPLAISNSRFAELVDALSDIPHLQRLRIHSRFPVVIPQRIDEALLKLVEDTRFQWLMVVHSNHPNELCADFATAMTLLRERQVTLLNQSVLLRGVNDDAQVLAALSDKLFSMGIMPYYLHLMDPVAGAAHFDIPEPQSTKIYQDLLGILPGYLVPKLVKELPDRPAKTPINP